MPANDTRRDRYLIGRNTDAINKEIGGCPHANTLSAWSDYFQWHVLVAIPCKRWGCSHCGRVKTAQLAKAVHEAKPNRFITLTTDPKLWNSGREAYDGVRRKLPDFTKAIRREVGPFEYMRVLELHKNGMPHWHMLARSSYVPQPLIKRVWAELSGATIVDVRAVRKHFNVAVYLTKYLCKVKYIEWTNRRVSWSKHFFPKYDPPTRTDWQLSSKVHDRESPATIMQQEWFGWRAVRIGDYAWTFERAAVLKGSDRRTPPKHLVSCIEDCGTGLEHRSNSNQIPQATQSESDNGTGGEAPP